MSAQDPFAPPPPQEWLTPAFLPSSPYGQPPPPKSPAIFELRPLTLSEVLDRTFALYRSRFWLFAGISSGTGAIQALVAAAQAFTQGHIMRGALATAGTGSPPPPYIPGVGDIIGFVVIMVGTLLSFLAFSVTTAASVYAVGETYLGRQVSIKESFGATIKRWYRYIAIGIWQGISLIWLPMVIIVPGFILIAVRITSLAWLGGLLVILGFFSGFVGGYILYLRNMLAVPASVTERLKIRASMRRSKVLSSGSKVRIFVLSLISMALYVVVGMLQAPFTFAAMFSMAKLHGAVPYILQAIALIITFVGHTVVAPVLSIGLVLVYFDQRVRKEAFDIAILMGEERALEYGAPTVQVSAAQVAAMAPYSPEAWTPAGTPAPGYPPPGQGYVPPAQGYIPPAQSYAQTSQSYAPPVQGYEPPDQSSTPSAPATEGSSDPQGGDGSAV